MNTSFKIVIGGSSGSGKTSLVQRFIDNSFNHDHPLTIGVDFDLVGD